MRRLVSDSSESSLRSDTQKQLAGARRFQLWLRAWRAAYMYDGATVCDSGGGAFVIQNFLWAARQVRDRFHTHMRDTCR